MFYDRLALLKKKICLWAGPAAMEKFGIRDGWKISLALDSSFKVQLF